MLNAGRGAAVSEQRASERTRMQMMPAWATAIVAGRPEHHQVRVVDLSGFGASLLSGTQIGVGASLQIDLPACDGTPVQTVHGTVVWSVPRDQQWRLGVRFSDVSDRDRHQIVRRVFFEEVRRMKVLEQALRELRWNEARKPGRPRARLTRVDAAGPRPLPAVPAIEPVEGESIVVYLPPAGRDSDAERSA
jgi:hypothetical protein